MKKSILFLSLSLLTGSMAHADPTDQDCLDDREIIVIIDDAPVPEPTEEEMFAQKMRDALPYDRSNGLYFDHERRSLGQLVKLCDHIVIGTVTHFSILPDKDDVPDWDFNNIVSLSFNIENVIFGSVPHKHLTLSIYWPADFEQGLLLDVKNSWNWKPRPKLGDKLLIFLVNAEIDEYIGYEFAFNFLLKRVDNSGSYHLLRQNGGVRYLDTPENTTNYLAATKGYLRELRGERRNYKSYYSFLADLVQSPVRSIREDARSDLIFLYGTCPSLDKQQILADERIDEAIKFWLNTNPTQLESPRYRSKDKEEIK